MHFDWQRPSRRSPVCGLRMTMPSTGMRRKRLGEVLSGLPSTPQVVSNLATAAG